MFRLRQVAELGEGECKRRVGLLLTEGHNTEREFPDGHRLLEEGNSLGPLAVGERLLTALKQIVKHVVFLSDIIADLGQFDELSQF